MLPKITDKTRPNNTVRVEDIAPGSFFKFTGNGDTRLYRKVSFCAHEDAKKLFDVRRLVELVETGEVTLAREGVTVYEVEVEVVVKSIVN